MANSQSIRFPKKTLESVDVSGKTVLLRADYNVPLNKDGTIADDYRITQSLPTLEYLIKRKSKIVIISHLGRPDGQVKPEFSLEPVAKHLGEILKMHVGFVPECIGDRPLQALKHLRPGGVLLLDNLRFHPEEEANDQNFAAELSKAAGADLFVQDGFGVVHRAHASTSAITHQLPSVAGLLLEKEYLAIKNATENPKTPLVAVMGGAKVSDKIKIIRKFVNLADQLIIGGAMANTFLAYKGQPVGKSLVEPNQEAVLDEIYAAATKKVGQDKIDEFILLPTDVAVAAKPDKTERRMVVSVSDVKEDDYILDIGPTSVAKAAQKIASASTIIWNGTLGMAEIPQFSEGSCGIAEAITKNTEAISVIGGGDTADFVLSWDTKKGKSFSHVSTGGGASLELMSGQDLPGITALMDT